MSEPGLLARSPAFWLRAAVAWSSVLYVFLRFGADGGVRTLIAVSLYQLLDVALLRLRTAGSWLAMPIVAAQIVIVSALFLAPAPLGFASDVPVTAMMQSPFALILLCMLAATASPPRPWVTLVAGALVTASWAIIRPLALAAPHTITKDQIVVSHFKSGLALLEAITTPNYFNVGVWRVNLGFIVIVAAILAFTAFRTQRLARRTANRQAERDALSAYFSPQIVDVILSSGGLAPRDRDVAVLNCDLVGFTRLAESMAPEAVAETLRRYRTVAEDAVLARQGAILSHQGDGFTAVFGLIEQSEPTVAAALSAARAIKRQWADGKGGAPQIGMGIDFGRARVGLVGRGRTLTLLMLGSPVERAQRLQAATRNTDKSILIGNPAGAELARAGSPLDGDDAAIAALDE